MRIGVTSRIVEAPGYREPRDALAHDWAAFLAAALPGVAWMQLPNLGAERIVPYCEQWEIDRLILSGGEDIGVSALRDQTELRLLDWAEAQGLPVLGICRGMQLLARRAGADLIPVAAHVATTHAVTGEFTGVVNSFHRLVPAACPENYRVMARAEDGSIEAIAHRSLRWEGWMWHPEREAEFTANDIQRLKVLFS
ncbi:MAG TPA: gamma-glutamyl-gamma-aminobutyrate hydrolase family protein [Planctomycetota bacterium]|nr:gamma-glutamyl-gamma-aminobutyrate hydrolase family protein [Planctomycetota bacterium]